MIEMIVAFLGLALPIFSSAGGAADGTEERCRTRLTPKAASPSIAFVSDTQEPIWIETLWLASNDNRKTTRALFDALAQDELDGVFHGGDLVSQGSSQSAWRRFRQTASPLTRKGIPFFAVPGNHEYLFQARRGRRLFEKEFPSFSHCPWQTIELGSLAVVLLNSNFKQLEAESIVEQDRWLAAELARLDQDARISAVIVLAHHSPYTNGKVVGPSAEVQEHFVPRFLASAKTRLLLTGHSHVYEHFRQGDKDFMVIGGGGGLLHPLETGADRSYEDLYPQPREKGFFHYLKVTAEGRALPATVMRYDSGRRLFLPDYRVRIPK
ncbi:MAG: metallophosphoesterase [Oligoflexia bacterium]|nr:metallophosphoesterase [Oligoflexia bacterium]